MGKKDVADLRLFLAFNKHSKIQARGNKTY